MKRILLLVLVIAVAAACSSGSSKSTAKKDWDPNALKVADGLQSKLLAAHRKCVHYQAESYSAMVTVNGKQGVPVPLAVTNCLGEDDEDLTFEVFADTAAAQQFIDAKRKVLCDVTAKKNLTFAGFIYVDGGAWILEPDKEITAEQMAKILGGSVKTGDCKGL